MNSGRAPVFWMIVTRLLTQLPTWGVHSPIQSAPPLSAIFFIRAASAGALSRHSFDLRKAGAYGSVQYFAPTNGFWPCFQPELEPDEGGGDGCAAGEAGAAATGG